MQQLHHNLWRNFWISILDLWGSKQTLNANSKCEFLHMQTATDLDFYQWITDWLQLVAVLSLLVFEATISKVLTFQISLSSITVLLSFRTSVDVHQPLHEVGLRLEAEWLITTFANFIRSHANHKQLHCALQRLLSPRNKNANKRRLWSLYRTFIYSEQMAIRCSHCKHTTVQSLQHTRTPTHTDFTQSITEQHMTHSLKHSHTVAAEQRRHHSGVCSDKHRRKIK